MQRLGMECSGLGRRRRQSKKAARNGRTSVALVDVIMATRRAQWRHETAAMDYADDNIQKRDDRR